MKTPRGAAWLVAGALLLVAAGRVTAQVRSESIPRAVVSTVNSRIRGALRVGAMTFSPPNQVTLESVTLVDPEGARVLSVPRLVARVDLAALASKDLVLSDVDVQDARVDLVVKDGKLNLARALEPRQQPEGERKPLVLEIRQFTVIGAEVAYGSDGLQVDVSTVGATGNVLVHGSTVVVESDVEAAATRVNASDIIIDATHLSAAGVRFAGKSVQLTNLRFRVGGEDPSDVSGRVLLTGEDNLDIGGRVVLPRGWWPEGLGERPVLVGRLVSDFTVAGAFADPVVELNAQAPSVRRDTYELTSVRASARVTRRRVDIHNARGRMAGGEVTLAGVYGIKDTDVDLRADLRRVGLHAVLPEETLPGTASGRATLKGVTRKNALSLQAVVAGEVALKETRVAAARVLDVKARAKITENAVTIQSARVEGPGVDATAEGGINLKRKTLAINARATVAQTEGLFARPPENLEVESTDAVVEIRGTTSKPTVRGVGRVTSAVYAGVPMDRVLVRFRGEKERVEIQQLKARVAEGRLLATGTLDLTGTRPLRARAQLRDARLSTHDRLVEMLDAKGRVDANMVVWGTLDHPAGEMRVLGRDVQLGGEELRNLRLAAHLGDHLLVIDEVGASLGQGTFRGTGSYQTETKAVQGTVELRDVDLAGLNAGSRRQLRGQLNGVAQASGTSEKPLVTTALDLKDMSRGGTAVGEARITGELQGRMVTARAEFPSMRAVAEGHYHLDERVVDAELNIPDGDLHALSAFVPNAPVLRGKVQTVARVHGSTKNPEASGWLRVQQVVMEREGGQPAVELGDANVEFKHMSQQLQARGDLFGMVSGKVEGSTAKGETLFAEGMIHADHLERFAPALAARNVELSTHGEFRAILRPDDLEQSTGTMQLTQVRVVPHPQPPIINTDPALFTYERGTLRVVRLIMASPTARLEAGGTASRTDVDLAVVGNADLALASLFSSEITRTEGAVDLDARVHRVASGPYHLEGQLAPQPGSSMRIKSLASTLTFRGGRVVATEESLVFDRLDANMDDGEVMLDGNVTMLDGKPQQLDVVAKAYGLSWRTSRGPLEGGFDLALTGTGEKPRLVGTVDINEGNLRESYEVQNFIVQRPSAAPSEPLWKRVPTLAPLAMELRIAAQSVRARADMGPYLVDTVVRADFAVTGTLREPTVTGAVEVSEGKVRVGRSRFDMESASVDFPLRADNRVEPELHLVARTVIPPESSPTQTELPVILTLDGPLDRMIMDLRAEDEGERLSRMELLSLVVTGKPSTELLGTTGGEVGGDVALRLYSSQALGFVERRIEDRAEELIEGPVEVRLETGYTSGRATARWEASERLQLEGTTDLDYGATDVGFGLRGAARARLLIIDHTNTRALQTVHFEGNLSDVGVHTLDRQTVDMKLRLRFFEF
ncbi:MAG: translocation/assembly module TamB domain-containing protein [Myxococcota bacterium]